MRATLTCLPCPSALAGGRAGYARRVVASSQLFSPRAGEKSGSLSSFGLTSLIPPGREPGLLFFTRDCLWLDLATPAWPHPGLPPSFERCGVRNHASCACTRRLFQHGVYNRASCARTGCDFEHALAKAQVASMTSLAEMHTGRDFQHDAQNRVPCAYTRGCFQHGA